MSQAEDESAEQTSSELPSAYWSYLSYAAHAAYSYSKSRELDDPRGPPGTVSWSFDYYGVNSPP